MYKIISSVLIIFMCLSGQAQIKFSGRITDQQSRNIPLVNLKLVDEKNNVRCTQTDSLGFYAFHNLNVGEYSIDFTSINFEPEHRKFSLKLDTVMNIRLRNISHKLADIEVSSKKPLIERKIDRTVFNVENSVSAIGSDALELLAKVPGVRVLNDRISLIGKGVVNVMVNDKLIQLTDDELSSYLKSLSSDQISRIEVITNPPSKYDAQGNNGLINFVIKKVTTSGFKGSVNGVFTQASHVTASTGGNFSYQKDKITINTSFNIRKGSLVPFEQTNIFYQNQTWNTVNKDRNFRTIPAVNLSIDDQLSKKTLVGISYNGGLTNFHSEENIKTAIYNQVGRIDSMLNSDAAAKIRSHFNAANVFLKYFIDSAGKQIVFNGDWFGYNENRSRFFNNTSYLEQGNLIPNSFAEYLSTSKQTINFYTMKVDVDLPFRTFKVSMGAKISFINNQSDVAFFNKKNNGYEPDASQVNNFNYKENTQALYLDWNKRVNAWDFKFGLRLEHTQVNGISINELNKNQYFQLFPTAFIVYKPNEQSVFSIQYGRRINRPAYRKLNPFRWYSNQFAYAEGNPFLNPSFNHNIEFSHSYKNKLISAFSYSKTLKGFNDINFVDEFSNIQFSKPVNFITGNNYQLSNTVILDPFKIWQSINQIDVFYNVAKSNIMQTVNNLHGFGAYFSTSNQLVLNKPKTIFADVNFWYLFPTVDGLNNNKSQYNLDLGIKALFLNKKLQLAISSSDVLKSNQYRFTSLINNIKQEYKNYYDDQQLRITVRYHFGNDKIKQLDRKTGNDEERKRSN